MTGISGPNTPPDDFSGYHPPSGGPNFGAASPAPNPAGPYPANSPAMRGAAFGGGQPPSASPPAWPSGVMPPGPTTPRPAPATRPVRPPTGGRGRTRGPLEDRDPNTRFQGFITVVGLIIGLLCIAGGGLLNATTPIAGLGPTATTTTMATTHTSTPTATATVVPARLSISPTTSNVSCASNTALVTLTLSNPGGQRQGLDWSAAVDSANSANVTLSTTSDGKNPINGGHLNGGNTTTVYVVASSDTFQSPVTITFTTTPAASGPVTATITCT